MAGFFAVFSLAANRTQGASLVGLGGEASDGAEAVALVEERAPDVVLMDVRMPEVDGIEATRRIAASRSSARIIILTTHDVDEYVFAAVRAGASGFMLKDIRPADLVEGSGWWRPVTRCSRRASRGACSTASRARCPRPPRRRTSAS